MIDQPLRTIEKKGYAGERYEGGNGMRRQNPIIDLQHKKRTGERQNINHARHKRYAAKSRPDGRQSPPDFA